MLETLPAVSALQRGSMVMSAGNNLGLTTLPRTEAIGVNMKLFIRQLNVGLRLKQHYCPEPLAVQSSPYPHTDACNHHTSCARDAV